MKRERRSGQRAEVWSSPVLHCMSPYSVILWILCEQFVFFLPTLPKINSNKNSNKNQKETRRRSVLWAVFANGVFQFRLSPA